MRILQINTCYKTGSTGRTTYELHKYLQMNGYESYVAYGSGEKPSSNHEYRIVSAVQYYSHDVLAAAFGDQGFYSKQATKNFLSWVGQIRPDIIHLRNLHGNFINLPLLFLFLAAHKEISTVITTHDFWFISGYCTSLDCNKWKNGCGPCPCFHKNKHDWFFDRSKKLYKCKKEGFLAIKNLGVQCNSKYSASIIEESFLKNRPTSIVYNWINLSIFHPSQCPKRGKPVVLGVWSSLDEKSERFNDFLGVANAMKDLATFELVGKFTFNSKRYPYIKFLGGTDDQKQLARYYSEANVLFDPSLADTFGKVVAESLACGTPAVVYDGNTALPELIGPGCGRIISKRDLKQASSAIADIISKPKTDFINDCTTYAKKKFDYETNCKLLVDFYTSLAADK